jgi:O-succinylbenzoic acid--CoA ligase
MAGRLALGWLESGGLRPLPLTADGWWRSGDAGRIGLAGLQLLGRLDGALSSGGETVFPEQLEARLQAEAAAARAEALARNKKKGAPA